MIYEAATEAAPAPVPPMARAKERIMVVDDEVSICDMLGRFLTIAGYRVDLFANGGDAWAALQENPKLWDLLLTDQTMPEMTGDVLAAKALKLNPNIPVIICSGFSEGLNDKHAHTLGVKAYLQKPVNTTTLLTEIAKALYGNTTKEETIA
jgi:DNA-binding NtrC family response regulator